MSGKASDDVFTLIQSLSMSEKRYFKAFALMGNVKSDTIYVRLFDIIEAQKEYNETKVLEKLKLDQPQQLSNQKKYLGELILESLRIYHAGRSVDAQLWAMVTEIELLYRRRLLKLCLKQCKKAKELAMKYEKNFQLAVILYWEERNMGEIISQEKMEAEHDQIFLDSIANAKKILRIAELRSLHHQILKPSRLGGLSRWGKNISHLHKIIQNPILKTEPDSYRERSMYHSIFTAYYVVQGDWKQCYVSAKKLVTLMEENPHQIAEETRPYTSALNVFILSCIYTHNEKELALVAPKVVGMVNDPLYNRNNNSMYGLLFCCNSILHYFMHSGEFERGAEFCESIQKTFDKHFENINKGTRFSVYLSFATIYFGLGDYKRSLQWINKILSTFSSAGQEDYHMSARLLSFIVHYEKDDDNDLERFVKSTQRYLISNNRESKIESAIIDFIRKKIAKKKSEKETRAAFEELKITIEELSKDPIEKVSLLTFDFLAWIDAQIRKKTFAEVMREKWRG